MTSRAYRLLGQTFGTKMATSTKFQYKTIEKNYYKPFSSNLNVEHIQLKKTNSIIRSSVSI